MAEFLYMGGYGFYVWSSYLVVTLCLLWQYLVPWLRIRRLLKTISDQSDQTTERSADST